MIENRQSEPTPNQIHVIVEKHLVSIHIRYKILVFKCISEKTF